jgi:hypothetical protein
MKKLLLAASLCLVAVVAAPVASASAAEKVNCTIEGTAHFTAGLTAGGEYKFNSEAGACVGSGGKAYVVVTAKVSGTGELSCSKGKGKEGSGKIELEEVPSKTVLPAKTFTDFEFTSELTQVTFKVPSLKAEGEASFATDLEGVLKCAEGKGAAIKNLKFVAHLEAEV